MHALIHRSSNAVSLTLASIRNQCFTLLLDTVQTLVKYIIHLGDLSRQGPCESRRAVQYYTEFVSDTMILVTTLGHYLHIMVSSSARVLYI